MTTEWISFGDPDRLEIAVRWRGDSEPRARRPAAYGWSVGDLKITLANRILTKNVRGAANQSFVSWYLFPVLEWLGSNWAALLHEEDYSWPERTGSPGAIACPRALDRWVDSEDAQGKAWYGQARDWFRRHSLRAASSGGLLPDLFFRRYLETVEISWSGTAPLFAPDGFTFVEEGGAAYLPVADVATPLWALLEWAISTSPARECDDQAVVLNLAETLDSWRNAPQSTLQEFYAPQGVLKLARAALEKRGEGELLDGQMVVGVPAISEFSAAVAMFGGVSPSIGVSDVDRLIDLLASRKGEGDSPDLARLVENAGPPALQAPHLEGQRLANDLLEEIFDRLPDDFIDIRAIATTLDVTVTEVELETDSIRGVALAGPGIGPSILINLTSPYSQSEEGKRFTIAHELCHVLHDRAHARRVAISSGPWAPPGVEKRANAFAAMTLMPKQLIDRMLPNDTTVGKPHVAHVAEKLCVSESALVEHLYNIGRIDEIDRERLRQHFRH